MGDRPDPRFTSNPTDRMLWQMLQELRRMNERGTRGMGDSSQASPGGDGNPLIAPGAGHLYYRMADPLSRDNNALPGFDYGYSPGQNVPLNSFPGPVYGTPAAPGPITTISYVVLNTTHDVYFRLASSSGPFMVQVRVGDRQTVQTVTANGTGGVLGSGINAVNSALYFGNTASFPGTYLCPLRTETQDVIYFDCYDIANLGAPNYVSILMQGVVRGG